MKGRAVESPLQIVRGNKVDQSENVEQGSIPNKTFFYFTNQCFEVLDDEILEWISKNDPSHTFLYDDEEDIYSLDDGSPIL